MQVCKIEISESMYFSAGMIVIRYDILILFQDADVLRFCCEFTRPTLTDRAKGKVAYGKNIYCDMLS